MFRRRGTHLRVVEAVEKTQRQACRECMPPPPRNTACLEPLPEKWHTTESDLFEWTHPTKRYHMKGVVFVDSGSRFIAARWAFPLVEEQARNITSQEVIAIFFVT